MMSANEPTASTELLGRETAFRYSESTVGYAIVALRVVMGWALFYSGTQNLMASDFEASVAGMTQGAATAAGNPFSPVFAVLADYTAILAPLNAWGLTLVGAALIVGAFVRWSAFWGAVMMLFYWMASLPLEYAIVVDDHVVYALLLFGLGAFGAGRLLGVDGVLERRTDLLERYPALRYLTG
jgi:thiosulfate dehydrogenase [quinone] large subunit